MTTGSQSRDEMKLVSRRTHTEEWRLNQTASGHSQNTLQFQWKQPCRQGLRHNYLKTRTNLIPFSAQNPLQRSMGVKVLRQSPLGTFVSWRKSL
jgi:hypothetical protein